MEVRQHGFTLVELVVVIVILAVVSSVAISRYASYTREARIAALNGLAGAIRSSVMIVQARFVATGATTSPVTLVGGTTVAVGTAGTARGVPRSNAGGISNAVNVGGTFVYSAGGAVGTYNFPTPIANCNVRYTAATGTVTIVSGGC